MKASRILFILLLSASILYSFNVQDYLYSKETINAVTQENFTLNGTLYVLYKINGSEAFLIKDNSIVTNSAETENVIREYYKGKYAPTQLEIQEVRGLVVGYNSSRNDGGRWKGQEEAVCLDILLINGKLKNGTTPLYCNDDASCEYISKVFYYSAPYTEGIRQTVAYIDAANALKEFSYSSKEIGACIDNGISKLDSITDDTTKETFTYIKECIPKIKAAEAKIEVSIYRTPRYNDSADLATCLKQNNGRGCFGLCPDMSFNETYLNLLETKVNSILSTVTPFADYKTTAANLLSNTQNRVNYKEGEEKAEIYISKFSPMQSNGEETIANAEITTTYVNDAVFKSKLEQFKEMHDKINTSITKRNFTAIDTDLEDYAAMEKYIRNQTDIMFAYYNDTYNAKQDISAHVFVAQTKGDLPPDFQTKLDAVLIANANLDNQFQKGLKPAEYLLIKEGYQNVTIEVLGILEQQKEFIALSKMRSMSRRINTGVYNVAIATTVITPADIATHAKSIPILIAVMTWMSLTAFVVFAFLGVLMKKRPARGGKISLALSLGLLLAIIVGITIFSIEMYIYLDKTSNNSDVEEFMIGMQGKNSIIAILELQDVPLDVAKQIKECAKELELAVADDNMTVITYEMYSDKCHIGEVEVKKMSLDVTNMTNQSNVTEIPTCTPPADQTSFVFKYSALNQKPVFSSIYENKAYIVGDAEYFEKCYIAAVFQ